MTKRAIGRAAALTAAAIALPGVMSATAGHASATQGAPDKGITVALRAKNSDKCLTAAGPGDGSAILQLPCNGRAAQQWTLRRGTTEIRNDASGKCLDVWGGVNGNGVAVTTWHCDGASQQRWRLAPRGRHTFEIRSAATGRCLDVPNSSELSGVPVVQWACKGSDNQAWTLSHG